MSQQTIGYRVGWFSSGQGEGSRILLGEIARLIREGTIPAKLAFVFCNQPDLCGGSNGFYHFVDHIQALHWVTFSFEKFQAVSNEKNPERLRQQYDKKVLKLLQEQKYLPVDVIVLAGYKQIVGWEMCQRLKMINLHPALPGGPIGTWQQVIWQLIKNRAEYSGITIHLVSPEVDKGTPIVWCKFPIRGEPFDAYWKEVERESFQNIRKRGENLPLFKLLRQEGLKREVPLLIAVLKALAKGELRIENGEVLKVLRDGLDISSMIETNISLVNSSV